MPFQPGFCWLCEETSTVVCPQCHTAEYCSTQCAEDDLEEHQEECADAPGAELPCAYCGRLSRHLSRCRRCHLVAYCSASCSQLDARLHLPVCLAGRDAVLRVANRLTHGAQQCRLPVYFGGGVHALNLLRGLDMSGEEPCRFLQLSAELPHLMRTAAGAARSRRPLAATLASDSPHQLARACLLLYLLTSGPGPAAVVQVLYSLRLETETARQLHAALEQLVSATYSGLLQLLPWVQLGRAALSHWQEVWRAWLQAMQDAGALARMQAAREAALQQEPARSTLQRYLATLTGRQQRAARQLLLQHGCLLGAERARTAATANVTLLALNPRHQQLCDLRLGAEPPAWLQQAAADAATVFAPSPPPGPLADWDSVEVTRALGADVDVVSGCRQLAEDCAAALQQRVSDGRLSVRLVQFSTTEQLDDHLAELRFERIFTADAADRLGLFSVLEMCEVLLAPMPHALIVSSHSRWAELSPPVGTTVSALRGGGTLAWDRQLDTDRFRLTAYLQAARLAYTAAARDKDVLDARLQVPTTLEVSTFGTLLLTDPSREAQEVAPFRFRRRRRAVSAGDPHLRLLEWRRDPDGVRRQLAENRARLAAEQPTPAAAAADSPQHRGPGQYERWVQGRPASDQPQPQPARLPSPLYGSMRRRAGSMPSRRRQQPASPAQHMPPYSLYENLSNLTPAARTQSLRSPRPPPTQVLRTSSLLRGGSVPRRGPWPRPAEEDPLYETIAAVRKSRNQAGPQSVPATLQRRQGVRTAPQIDEMTPTGPAFRRTNSLRGARQFPGSRRRDPSGRLISSPAEWYSGWPSSPPASGYDRSPAAVYVTSDGAIVPPSGSPGMYSTSVPMSAPALSSRMNRTQVDGALEPAPVSPTPSEHSAALQTPEGRRRLVQKFVFPPAQSERSPASYGTIPRRSASLYTPDRQPKTATLVRNRPSPSGGFQPQLANDFPQNYVDDPDSSVFERETLTPTPIARSPLVLTRSFEPQIQPNVYGKSPNQLVTQPTHSTKTESVARSSPGQSSQDPAPKEEVSEVAPAAVRHPEDIDRMMLRREPKNIADWLREDKDRQREFEQQSSATDGGTGRWYRQDTPLPSPMQTSKAANGAASEPRSAPTRPGRITPATSAAGSAAAAGRRRAFRARGATTTERLLASLERDWSIDVPDTAPQTSGADAAERPAQTIAELGARAEVAQWLLDRLLQDEARQLSTDWLTEQRTEHDPPPAHRTDESTQTAEQQAANRQQPEGKDALVPDVTDVNTPAPKPQISGPFDVNAQEVGKLESPRFAEIKTPAPKVTSREQLFADIRQYKSPITGNQLVTFETPEASPAGDARSPTEPLYSSSVYIPSPEQRIVIPIPSESLVLQPPAIKVPQVEASPAHLATSQSSLPVSQTLPKSLTQPETTDPSDSPPKPALQPRPASRLAGQRQELQGGRRRPSRTSPPPSPPGAQSAAGSDPQKRAVPALQSTKPAPARRRVLPDFSSAQVALRAGSDLPQHCRSPVEDPGPAPADQDGVDRSHRLSQRRAKLMERAASQPPCPGPPAARTSIQSRSTSPPAVTDTPADTPAAQPDSDDKRNDSRSPPNSVQNDALEKDDHKTTRPKYIALVNIVPSPPAMVSPGTQMMWKIPLVDTEAIERQDSNKNPESYQQDNNGNKHNNSSSVHSSPKSSTRAVDQKPSAPSTVAQRDSYDPPTDAEHLEEASGVNSSGTEAAAELPAGRRRSRPLSMDAEYHQMKQKLRQLASSDGAGCRPAAQPSAPPRSLSISQEVSHGAALLHPVRSDPGGPGSSEPTTPQSPGPLVRTGSVRQRAALFARLAATSGPTPAAVLPPSPPPAEPAHSPFTRQQGPEGAPARAQMTVTLSRSPPAPPAASGEPTCGAAASAAAHAGIGAR